MPHTKQHLRTIYQQKRDSLTQEQALRANHLITEHVLTFPGLKPDSTIAGYHPMRNEVHTLPILSHLHHKGHRTALPIIQHIHSPLNFHSWKPGDALVHSVLFKSVLEPSPVQPVIMPDIILVPLLAFDRNGYRLGYGSGAYDRTLAHLKEIDHPFISLGMAYSIQEANDLPHISFDQQVDYIITEKEIIHC